MHEPKTVPNYSTCATFLANPWGEREHQAEPWRPIQFHSWRFRMTEAFKLTYATMFNPPEELHERFDKALADTLANLGKEYAMIIDGKEKFAADKVEDRSPADTTRVLGLFQKGTEKDAMAAMEAARKAFPAWSRMPWQNRVQLMRKAADLIDERIYHIGVAEAMEVGKEPHGSAGGCC
jgi:hypothetical protein